MTLSRLSLLSALLFSLLAGCADSNGSQSGELIPPTDAPMKRASYGIGSGWYSFSLATFRLTAFDDVFEYSTKEGTSTIQPLTYYHPDTGRSGYLTFRYTPVDGEARDVFVASSVKEGPVCLELPAFEGVACDEATVDLTLRTDKRPSPSAGFAAPSPAIYLRRGPEVSLTRVRPNGDRVDEPSYRGDNGEPGSLSYLLSAGALNDDYVAIQMNAALRLVQLRVVRFSDNEAEIEARCTKIAKDQESTEPFEEQTPSSLVVDVPDTELVMISYCGEDGIATVGTVGFDEFDKALWPSNSEFDALIGRRDGLPLLLPAPDNAIEVRNATWDSEEGTRLPAEIWEDSF